MKLVKWQDQERVDQNDMEAINDFLSGEFRRQVRALLLGDETETGIIRGFKVEAQGSPDSTIRVRLDPGSQPGAAILAENDGASTYYGQLAGDRGAQGTLEGNATYTIDFSPDPPGTYYVEATFVYADGETDNRAYWNDTTNLEYVASNPTRRLPTLSVVRRASPAGGEWTTLASIVWGGGTVVQGDITDLRNMLFEGVAPNYQTSQTGSGGVPDFSRLAPRADYTSDTVYSALRKIGRQIQDLKGPNESGQWDFFSRPQRPMDPLSLLNAGVTKSIATLDTYEFVVGDGSTTWGDFSGSAGLQDCLSHIEASEASLPSRLRIRLTSKQTGLTPYLDGSPAPIWTCNVGITLATAKHIEIVGDCSKSDIYGRVPVAFTHSSGTMFALTAGGSLTLTNIAVNNLPTNELYRSYSAPLHLDNSMLVVSSATEFVVRTHAALLSWNNSEVYGAVQMFHGSSSQDVDGFSVVNCRLGSRVVWSTQINGYFRGWGEATFGDNPAIMEDLLNQGTFENCEFFYFTTATNPSASREAHMDLRGVNSVSFDVCDFSGAANWNLHLVGVQNSKATKRINWRTCRYTAAPPITGNHTVDNGYTTTNGTGWSLYLDAPTANLAAPTSTTLENQVVRSLRFEDCVWDSSPAIDSGAIGLFGAFRNVVVDSCRFGNVTFPSITYGGSPRYHAIRASSTTYGDGKDSGGLTVRNCNYHRFSWGATEPFVRMLVLNNVHDVNVRNCAVDSSDLLGAAAAFTAADASTAVLISGGCHGVNIEQSSFRFFTGTSGYKAVHVNEASFNVEVSVSFCRFTNTDAPVRVETNASDHRLTMLGNIWDYGTTYNANKQYVSMDAASGGLLTMLGNAIINPPATEELLIDHSTSCKAVFLGNDFTDKCLAPTGTVNVGFGNAPPLNVDSAAYPVGGEYTYRTSKTRVLMVPLEGLIGQYGSTSWIHSSIDALDQKIYNENAGPAHGRLGLNRILPNASKITGLRVGWKRTASAPGTNTLTASIRRHTYDTSVPLSANSADTVLTVTAAQGATDEIVSDTTADASYNTVLSATHQHYLQVSGSTDAGLNDEFIAWIEITYTDYAARNN